MMCCLLLWWQHYFCLLFFSSSLSLCFLFSLTVPSSSFFPFSLFFLSVFFLFPLFTLSSSSSFAYLRQLKYIRAAKQQSTEKKYFLFSFFFFLFSFFYFLLFSFSFLFLFSVFCDISLLRCCSSLNAANPPLNTCK